MVYIDHEQERTRLERVYADMNEGELRSIATDAAFLTREAIQALSAEISRRGLDIAVPTRHPSRKPASQTEFTTRHGIVILGIIAGIGLGFIVLVLSFPEWFSGCVRGLHLRQLQ
jgi:hypothetical protein